jgi:hypothetical protein
MARLDSDERPAPSRPALLGGNNASLGSRGAGLMSASGMPYPAMASTCRRWKGSGACEGRPTVTMMRISHPSSTRRSSPISCASDTKGSDADRPTGFRSPARPAETGRRFGEAEATSRNHRAVRLPIQAASGIFTEPPGVAFSIAAMTAPVAVWWIMWPMPGTRSKLLCGMAACSLAD